MAEHVQGPAIARALAAPTRAAILDLLRAEGPLAVKEVADASGIHANVARGHLDVLVSAGLASATWRRNAAGGRPAKLYEATPMHVEEGPALVSDILATLIETVGPDPHTARAIALATGEKLARRIHSGDEPLSLGQQVELMQRALSSLSGGVRVVGRGDDWVEFEDRDCPFAPIAKSHPDLACSLDKSLKEGMMRALGADAWVEIVTSIAWGEPTCRDVVRFRAQTTAGESA